MLFFLVPAELAVVLSTMNLLWASGPRAPAEGLEVLPEAQREESGSEIAVTVRMLLLISGTVWANWRIVKRAVTCR